MRLRYWFFLVALLAAPAPLTAQADEARHSGRHHGPVEKLLHHRDRLGLTDGQVARLREINARMEERNRPFVLRLVEIRRAVRTRLDEAPPELSEEEREALRERGFEEARPLMRQIRENNHEAMREVGEVLTPEQRDRLREMIEQKKKKRKDRGRSWTPEGQRGRGP